MFYYQTKRLAYNTFSAYFCCFIASFFFFISSLSLSLPLSFQATHQIGNKLRLYRAELFSLRFCLREISTKFSNLITTLSEKRKKKKKKKKRFAVRLSWFFFFFFFCSLTQECHQGQRVLVCF